MAKKDPVRKAPRSVDNMQRRREALQESIDNAQKRGAMEEVKRLKKELGHINKSVAGYKEQERQALGGSK